MLHAQNQYRDRLNDESLLSCIQKTRSTWMDDVRVFDILSNEKYFNILTDSLFLINQVYCVATGRYACRNKYYGRSLDDSGFRAAIVEYLTGGGGGELRSEDQQSK